MFVKTAAAEVLLILLISSCVHVEETLDRQDAIKILNVCIWKANTARLVQIGRQENIGHSELAQYQYVRNMLTSDNLPAWAVNKIMEIFDMVFAVYGEKMNHGNIFSEIYADCVDELKALGKDEQLPQGQEQEHIEF